MAEPWASTLGTLALVGLVGLLLTVLSAGTYLLVLEIRYTSRIRKRARHDYRTARGTQHLRQLQNVFPTLRDSRRTRSARVKKLESQLGRITGQCSAELRRALSAFLVRYRLIEVQGVGSTLSNRIIRSCFRGSLRDLHSAYRVRGIGPSLQRAISAWVNAREAEFPKLMAIGFPGKQQILDRYADQERSLQKQLASESTTLSEEDLLYKETSAAIERLRKVKPAHFTRALRRNERSSQVPAWYFQGLYAAWDPMPEWFETLLSSYGAARD